MGFARKKPVEIEFIKFNGSSTHAANIKTWMETGFCSESEVHTCDIVELHIPTLEDGSENQVEHMASAGDYIIKGVDGEFYPCKPDIFLKTYEIL